MEIINMLKTWHFAIWHCKIQCFLSNIISSSTVVTNVKMSLSFSWDIMLSFCSRTKHGIVTWKFIYICSNLASQRIYSSMLSFTVPDINSTVTKLLSLGAELDGPIKYEIHGKVAAVRCIDGHMLGLFEPAWRTYTAMYIMKKLFQFLADGMFYFCGLKLLLTEATDWACSVWNTDE